MEEGGRKWKKVEEGSGKCLHCRVAEHGQTCGICGLLNGFVDDYWCLAGSRFREGNRRGADSQNSETVRYDFNLSDIVAMDVLQVELCYLCVTCDTCPGLFAAATRSMGMPRPRMFLGRFLGLPFFPFSATHRSGYDVRFSSWTKKSRLWERSAVVPPKKNGMVVSGRLDLWAGLGF